MSAERMYALIGVSDSRPCPRRANVWWNGIALSRANAQVAREVAQVIESPHNNAMPNTREYDYMLYIRQIQDKGNTPMNH